MSDVESLARLYMFNSVSRTELEAFALLFRTISVPAGQVLFRQGERADVAHLLVEGCLVVTVDADGDAREVGDVRPGEVVGETALYVPGGLRSATVAASSASRCIRLDPDQLDRATDNGAVVALEQQLLGTMSRRLRATNLTIQRAWKDEATSTAPPTPRGLADRLRSFFGGVL